MIPEYLLPLANHLLQSTLFAMAAGLLTLGFRKNGASVRYGLWLAASLKFLLPFSFLVSLGSHLEWREVPPQTEMPAVVRAMSAPFAASTRVPYDNFANPAAPAPDRTPVLLFALWLSGTLATIVVWTRRWRQVLLAVRAASPVNLGTPIPAMITPALLEPGVFGIRNPVLLLPEGIAEGLTPDQLQAIVVHEMCHVLRRDNLGSAAHMLVEALFWFHPLVWWLQKRLVEERERACDEAVLQSKVDPKVYAEGILRVCRLYLESPLVCVSGVTGSNLKKRIGQIMAGRLVCQMSFARKTLLATAGAAALALPVTVGFVAPQMAAQTPKLSFEVASVKPNKSDNFRSFSMKYLPGGRFSAVNIPLFMVIGEAYHIPVFNESKRLSGAPAWTREERFDIEATPPKGAVPDDLPGPVRRQRVRLMLQSLLADRFQMVIHSETRDLPIYGLTVGKNGLKLAKSKIDEKDCLEGEVFNNTSCHQLGGGQGRGFHGKAVDIADIAIWVENWTDRPLIDQTGLKGLYEVDTDGWVPLLGNAGPAGQSAESIAMADPTRPTLYMIFDKLGLKMEAKRGSVDTYVIERVERPTGN